MMIWIAIAALPSVGRQIEAMLLMPHRKKSSASTILTGKQSEIASGVQQNENQLCSLAG
jgi:hypothetical protein